MQTLRVKQFTGVYSLRCSHIYNTIQMAYEWPQTKSK